MARNTLKTRINTLVICGKTYKVKYNPKSNGGRFSCGGQLIEVGTRGGKEDTTRIIMHEVLEIIITEQGHRYALPVAEPENGDFLFSFNHSQFENIAQELAYVARQIYGS